MAISNLLDFMEKDITGRLNLVKIPVLKIGRGYKNPMVARRPKSFENAASGVMLQNGFREEGCTQ